MEKSKKPMISIIVCSKDKTLLEGLNGNVEKTIGCEFEILGIDNKIGNSICYVYNEGVKKAKYPYLCFVHEDVRFLTENWGRKVVEKLENNEVGVLGVAGSSLMPENGMWFSVKKPFVMGRVVHVVNGKERLDRYGSIREDGEVVVLDGLFLACRKEVGEKFLFDEELDGFHFYDVDFSLRVSKELKNIVTYDILLKHFSGGKKDESYERLRKKFIEKHSLPYTKLEKIPNRSFEWRAVDFDSNKNYPKMLIGCPTSKDYEYCVEEYLMRVFSLNYPNFDILLVDNSEGNEFYEKLKEYGIKVIKSEFNESAIKRVVNSRNIIRDYALKNEYDYFFSLEQDVIPPFEVIETLLDSKQKVISGLYFGFTNPYEFGDVKKITLMPVAYKLFNEEEKKKSSKEQNFRRLNELDINPPRKIAVRMTGLGCMIIHKDVLEKTKFRFDEERKNTDDRYFSDDVYDMNVPIVLDTRMRCKHLVVNKNVKWI
ncbi:hypothetical protein J4413_00665 [Candidatus Woesearchaeota archaeon]|nr:hypothetical protein [Candidatus Woesearchaeota archaeon]